MDLYQKKVNVGNKNRRNPKSQYIETEDTPSKNRKNIYTQKMIPQNDNYDIASGGENISNVRSSMEDLFANEDMKKIEEGDIPKDMKIFMKKLQIVDFQAEEVNHILIIDLQIKKIIIQ